jgi:hypothetical protein
MGSRAERADDGRGKRALQKSAAMHFDSPWLEVQRFP